MQPSASLPDHPPTAGQAQNKLENGENSAGIEVLVADQSGAVVANAEVILKQSGNEKKIQAKTDANGRAFFPGFSSGDYAIEVASAGFKILRTYAQFKSGDALSLRLVLRASEETMGIIVVTDAPLIDTSPTVSSTFGNQEFRAGSVR